MYVVTFEELTEHGRCYIGWFFEFKLHPIINDKGKLLNFIFTPENVNDQDR